MAEGSPRSERSAGHGHIIHAAGRRRRGAFHLDPPGSGSV